MSARYASQTEVSPERSRMEIETTLRRYGADKFGYAYDSDKAMIHFEASGRHVRFLLPLPDRDGFKNRIAGNGKRVSGEKDWEQAVRSAWRALALVIKAKLEAVQAGIVTFEEEFMAHIVLPDGSTVSDFITPQIAAAYNTGGMPALMPGSGV